MRTRGVVASGSVSALRRAYAATAIGLVRPGSGKRFTAAPCLDGRVSTPVRVRVRAETIVRAGSFCTGVAGLDIAAANVFGASTAWVSEIDPDACTVLAERVDAPNIGTLVRDSWDDVEPVDLITAGYPCQPFSLAGARQGTNDDRHLWPHIADALRALRPRYFLGENVAGHLSLGFDAVLGDLAALGFDAEWCLVPASAVGAPHKRERLYVLAVANSSDGRQHRRETRDKPRMGGKDRLPTERGESLRQSSRSPGPSPDPSFVGSDDEGHGRNGGTARPAPSRRATGYVEAGGIDRSSSGAHASPGIPVSEPRGLGSLVTRPRRQAPTDPDRDGREDDDGATIGRDNGHARASAPVDWGIYAAAVHRWETVIGRPAPVPRAHGRLNPVLVEWLMGFPEGWCTDLVPAKAALRLLGNSVVPQAATHAFELLADRMVS